jgi:signal transduction histidine kinase
MADSLAARENEAREAQDRLRALSHRLQTVRDEEAGRIARELHDELGQVLTGLKMDLARVRRICTNEHPHTASSQALEGMTEHVDSAIDSVRRISSELHPHVMDRLGLAAALDWLARDREQKAGLAVPLHIAGLHEPLDPLIATTVFRVVQESLTNVIRHAEASVAAVDLIESAGVLTLTVHDDGIGIDAAAADGPRSLGIIGMQERARLVGGTLVVKGIPGAGTTITLTIPLHALATSTPSAATEPTP